MDENELRELFKATNTAEPLSEGWPGLLRFGLAVAAAEREACAKACDAKADAMWAWWDARADCTDQGQAIAAEELAAEIRMRSNVQGDQRCAASSRSVQ